MVHKETVKKFLVAVWLSLIDKYLATKYFDSDDREKFYIANICQKIFPFSNKIFLFLH